MQEQEGENAPNENSSSCNFFNCSFSQIYNLSLLKKPEFSILVTSNMIFHFGVYTVFGFTVVKHFLLHTKNFNLVSFRTGQLMPFILNQPLPVGYFLPWGWPIVLAGSSMENLSMPLLESLETKVWSTYLSAFSFSMVYVRIINQF